jgi:hypothetical protein
MEDEPTPEKDPPLRFSQLQSTLITNAVVQGVLLVFTAMTFDGGFSNRMCGQVMMAYWLMTGWLGLRRGKALTTVDALLIRTGFLVWLLVTVIVEGVVRALYFGGI